MDLLVCNPSRHHVGCGTHPPHTLPHKPTSRRKMEIPAHTLAHKARWFPLRVAVHTTAHMAATMSSSNGAFNIQKHATYWKTQTQLCTASSIHQMKPQSNPKSPSAITNFQVGTTHMTHDVILNRVLTYRLGTVESPQHWALLLSLCHSGCSI